MNSNKIISVLVGLALVLGLAGIFLPGASKPSAGGNSFIAGATGDQFSSARIAAKVVDLSVGSTTTSILNSDARDRIIVETYVQLVGNKVTAGATLPILRMFAATSTQATDIFGGGTATSSNLVLQVDIATSTTNFFNASTSPGVIGLASSDQSQITRVWPAGTYLNFTTNGTTTATGVVGVRYLQQ